MTVLRMTALVLGGVTLAACAQPVPDSGAGVGFQDYAQYQARQAQNEAALTGALPAPAAVTTSAIPSSDLAAAGIGVTPGAPLPGSVAAAPLGAPLGAPLAAPAGLAQPVTSLGAPVPGMEIDPSRVGAVEASPGNAAPALVTGNTAGNIFGISDEQDFDAVATRESIESDAARRAQQAAQYQVIAPTALQDPGDTGPNIVEYALTAPNRLGQAWYSRFFLSGEGRMQRNCSEYRSADEAQRDFLERGGPDRDPRGLDPDGDGFACGWDPAPFLAAVGRG